MPEVSGDAYATLFNVSTTLLRFQETILFATVGSKFKSALNLHWLEKPVNNVNLPPEFQRSTLTFLHTILNWSGVEDQSSNGSNTCA